MSMLQRAFFIVAVCAIPAMAGLALHADEGSAEEQVTKVYDKALDLHREGRYCEAAPYYEEALRLAPDVYGMDHTNTGMILNNLAILYKDMGQYTKAERLYKRNLEIREAKLGPDHPDVAVSLNNLAILYWKMEQYAKAEPFYQRSLKILEAKLGPEHPRVAENLNNLAILYVDMGQYGKAEPLYQRSLKIKEAKVGRDHPDVAASLNNLAVLYKNMGLYARAERLYQRALKILEAALGPNHPQVASSLNNLALVYAAEEKWPEAVAARERERRIVRRHVARVLPALAEKEQLTFLQARNGVYFHESQSLAFERPQDQELVAHSAGWVLNGKAVSQESLAERAILARASHSPATASLAQELISVRRQLAALSLAPAKAGQEEARTGQLAQLIEREQQLSRRLGNAAGRPVRDESWIELTEIQKALPKEGVLVEISRFNLLDFRVKVREKQWQGYRYAAWVIPAAGEGKVQFVDLGPADKIEAAVSVCRKALSNERIRELGEPEAEKELRQTLETLAKVVVRPLLPHIGKSKQWYLSPDASLWLVPWAALPLRDGRYAIEEHRLTYLTSGRDLVRPVSSVSPTRSMIMADPNYDLGSEQSRAELRELVDNSQPPTDVRGVSDALRELRAARLPGTAAEAKAIQPKLNAYAGEESWLFQSDQALEGVFKRFKSPKVVVLSTHGFFLEDQQAAVCDRPTAGETKAPARTADGKQLENPLLRCGLLLAGCNNREHVQEGDEDGILTGLEIVGTDLRGTELVVLSACETGLGEVRNGEGVAGLRQAFQLAGARSVVATLWQIPDRESVLLMSAFFENLSKKQGKAEALRNAQLSRIKARRERNGAAHPFYWAAFTLTG